jgi:GWxTD domain-containing protein
VRARPLLFLLALSAFAVAQIKRPEKVLIEDGGVPVYRTWLADDVRWIIRPEEQAAFRQLQNDEERDNFVEQFWTRRDPTPDTEENEYKDEHYRRLFYANEQFGEKVAGRLTDRGRAYARYGRPDSRESFNAADGAPIERWRYRYIEGIGQEQILEFRDECYCGDFKQVSGPSAPPGESGIAHGPRTDQPPLPRSQLYKPPSVRFKDLEGIVSHHIEMKLVPFGVRVDFANVTPFTDLVPVTISFNNRDLNWREENDKATMQVNIFGRLTTLTGRIAQTFEASVTDSVSVIQLPESYHRTHDYWKVLALRPGRYRLDLVVHDVNADKIGTWSRGIVVPGFPIDEFAASPVIMASALATPKKVFESFVLGNSTIHPRVAAGDDNFPVFRADEKIYLWFQIYGLATDAKGNHASALVEYTLVKQEKKSPAPLKLSDLEGTAAGSQITVRKEVPLWGFEPGDYRLTIRTEDRTTHANVTQSALFRVQ